MSRIKMLIGLTVVVGALAATAVPAAATYLTTGPKAETQSYKSGSVQRRYTDSEMSVA
jgi:hypothetical protein